MKAKAINKFVTVKRLAPTRVGQIQLLETEQRTFYGIITSVGDGVKNKTIIKDRLVFCNGSVVMTINGVHFFKEEDIMMIFYKQVWRPLGIKLLLKRLNSEFKTESGIVIPDCYQSSDQTLHCTYIMNGVVDGEVFYTHENLFTGDTVRLKSWDKDIQEIEIDDNFFIIVKPSHILYKVESETESANNDASNRIAA